MTAEVMHWGGPSSSSLCVAATASFNAIGFDSHQTWAFFRAEASAWATSPFRLDNGERATMGFVRTLPPAQYGLKRLLSLSGTALQQLEPALQMLPRDARAAVLCGVSERLADARDPYFGPQRTAIERELSSWASSHLHEPLVQTIPRGHASLAYALLECGKAIASRQLDVAIVGGVDSYYDPLVVDILLEQERIFDQVAPDRFIPGEGAAYLLLTRPDVARRAGLPNLCAVESAATNEEIGHMFASVPCTGRGLSDAMRAITRRLKSEHRLLEWIFSDLTNESYRANEFQLAYPRAIAPGGLDTAGSSYRQVAHDDLARDFLPAVFGDLGAATMPTAAVVAAQSFGRGRREASNCMLLGSSTTADRGVVLVSRCT